MIQRATLPLLVCWMLCVLSGGMPLTEAGQAKKSGSSKGHSKMILVPGKSLGDAAIGMSKKKLLELGLTPDADRTSFMDISHAKYFGNDGVLVRLEDDRVVEIWAKEEHWDSVTYDGKKFPENRDPMTLRKYFRNCEPDVHGSGGILVYCENRGVELAYSYDRGFQGLAVVTPEVVEQFVGAGHK